MQLRVQRTESVRTYHQLLSKDLVSGAGLFDPLEPRLCYFCVHLQRDSSDNSSDSKHEHSVKQFVLCASRLRDLEEVQMNRVAERGQTSSTGAWLSEILGAVLAHFQCSSKEIMERPVSDTHPVDPV